MKDDDPEQRIRELERGFPGPTPGWDGSRNRPHFTPPRRSVPLGWRLFAVGAVLASIIVALAAVLHLLIGFAGKTSGGNAGPAGTAVVSRSPSSTVARSPRAETERPTRMRATTAI